MSRWLLVAALVINGPALAQRQPTGQVRGVIYDSLAGGPLQGARVMVRGTSMGATTDASGRYRLDSVPAGRRTLFVEHPVLDTIGLSNLAATLTVTAGRSQALDLALPSLWSMRRAACDGRGAAIGRDSGLIYGTLTDIHDGARLAGARVVVSWLVARRGVAGLETERPTFNLRTDSIGNYYACGVPTDYYVTVQGFAGNGSETGITERLLGARGVARHDIAINRRGTAGIDSLSGMRRGRATLAGVVRRENGDPRPSARVLVDDAVGEAMADSGGRFVLDGLPAGSHMAMARMIGYSSSRKQVELRDGDTTWVDFSMRELTTLDTIRVTASAWAAARIDEIEQRRRSGQGMQLTEEQIKDEGTLRAVFQQMPNLTVEGPSAMSYLLYGRSTVGHCLLNLFLDGRPAIAAEIQALNPGQILAIEYFARQSQAPHNYQTVGSSCGSLLVWTKFMR